MKSWLGLNIVIIFFAFSFGGCGSGGDSGSATPSGTVSGSTSLQKSGSLVGHTVTEIVRIAKGSLVLEGKLRPEVYPSSNLLGTKAEKTAIQPLNSSCPVISEPSAPSSNFTIVIDYGAGCVDSFDGIQRSGKITITVTNAVIDTAENLTSGVITLAFTSYKIGESTLGGSASINVSSLTSESWDVSLTVSDPAATQALVFKSTVTYGDTTDIETVNGSGAFLSSSEGSYGFTLEDLQYDFVTTNTPLTCNDPIGGSITLTTAFHTARLTFGTPTPGCGSAFFSLDGEADVVINLNENASPPSTSSVPLPPTGISAVEESAQIVIRWNAVAGATSYNLYMASQNGVTKSNYTRLPDGSSQVGVISPMTITGLTDGKTYYFTVTALNDNGESAESAEVSATPGGNGEQNSAVLVGSLPIINFNGINGYKDLIGLSYTDVSNSGSFAGFRETLKLLKQDTTNPDQLIELSSVYLGVDTLYHRVSDITLNDQWAVVTLNFNDGAQGWVALVSLKNGSSFKLDALLTIQTTLDRAIAGNNWLLVAANTSLYLYDITVPLNPILKKSFTTDSNTTALVALSTGFWVITNNGYGIVDTSDENNITYAAKSDLDIKGSSKAYLIGNKLYIGGPSKFAGYSKAARLDLATPSSPNIDLLFDQISGNFIDFAFDGDGNYFLLTPSSVVLLQEASGALSIKDSFPTQAFAGRASSFYAWANRFYQRNNIYKIE